MQVRKQLYLTYLFLFFVYTTAYAQELSVTLVKSDKECDLGKAQVIINSGASPFQVLWSNGSVLDNVENLEEGLYSVTITDNNLKAKFIKE